MNPFDGWTDEQQCRHAAATKSDGTSCDPCAPDATRWCAIGKMDRAMLDVAMQLAFADFLGKRNSASIAELNDDWEWTPAQFRAAWDEFQKEAQ